MSSTAAARTKPSREFLSAERAAKFILSKTKLRPSVGLVLGSGLGAFADEVANATRIEYKKIPNFPRSTAIGHAGRMVIGNAGDAPVAVMQGRVHFYEGYTPQQVIFPMRVMARMGIRAVLLTNAAGGINKDFKQGALVVLRDHINLQGFNPLIGPNDDRLGPAISRLDASLLEAVPGGGAFGRETAGHRVVSGDIRGAFRPELRDACGDSLSADDRRGPGGNVHGAGSDCRGALGNSSAGNLLRDEYGCGNSGSAHHHRGSDRNRRAREGGFRGLVARDSSTASRGRPQDWGSSMSEHDSLIAAARTAREHAYAPYSNFRVGAAVRANSGRIFSGCNVENATYGLTLCAERVAIFKAISEGERGFEAIAVVTDTDKLTPPCGACRQIIWEFCGDAKVVLSNLHGKIELHQMATLFPKPFDHTFL